MYRTFYGFSVDPFALNPDPKFLYLAPTHREALSCMVSGIKEKKGIILITGEVGVGKTILLYTLLKDLSDRIKTAFIFQPHLDWKDLLKNILRDLEIPLPEKEDTVPDLLLRFEKYLEERSSRNETVVMIIDEAQALDPQVLRSLMGVYRPNVPGHDSLQIILVGQPEVEGKLDAGELRVSRERIALRREIVPLNREEVRRYMGFRLGVAGRNVSEVFSAEAVKRVWQFARGVPRVVNLLCDRALLIGYSYSCPMVDSKIVNEAIQDLAHLRAAKPTPRRPKSRRIRPAHVLVGSVAFVLIVLGLVFLVYGDSILKSIK